MSCGLTPTRYTTSGKNAIDVEKKNLDSSDSGQRIKDPKMVYIVFAKAVEALGVENKKAWRGFKHG